jgi:hypothetical protein
MWGAKEDPENMMLSAVFSYDPKDPRAMPLDLQAADLVETGAATTALFSEPNNTNTMTPDEIKDFVRAELKAALAVEKPEMETEVEMAAAAEAEAGVTDADKKPEDEGKPAAMRAALRIHRATVRLTTAALAANQEETITKAEAKFSQAIGSGKFNIPSAESGDEVAKALAAYSGLSKPLAILKLAKDKPEVYNAFRASGKL